jgi:hypothetical protein
MAKNTNSKIERRQSVRDQEVKILDPSLNYRGKSYSELTTDWFNWFLSAHADRRNSGPVVFLRSHGLPNKTSGAYTSEIPTELIAKGTGSLPEDRSTELDYYPTMYINDPNVRTDGDKLQIFSDQAVFVPIIVSYKLASTPYIDWGYLQDYTGLLIDNGDNPPDESQLSIYNKKDSKQPIKLDLDMQKFRITTPVFTAIVPDAPYGTSIKDFLEEHAVPPGTYQAMVDGYFVMVKFPNPPKNESETYFVHAWASAGREPRGPYFSELLYEIEILPLVKERQHGIITTAIPARNDELINRILNKRKEIEGVAPSQNIINSIREKAKESIKAKISKVTPRNTA